MRSDMANGSDISNGKPSIVIYVFGTPKEVLSEIKSGIEEEGVFYDIRTSEKDMPAAALAERGAQNSRVDVGVGIARDGSAALHYKKMARPLYQMPAGSGRFRLLGNNAARLVKGIPLLVIDS
jgi:hypothetical protein